MASSTPGAVIHSVFVTASSPELLTPLAPACLPASSLLLFSPSPVSLQAWVSARKASDFSQFKDYLQQWVDISLQKAAAIDPSRPAYDVSHTYLTHHSHTVGWRPLRSASGLAFCLVLCYALHSLPSPTPPPVHRSHTNTRSRSWPAGWALVRGMLTHHVQAYRMHVYMLAVLRPAACLPVCCVIGPS